MKRSLLAFVFLAVASLSATAKDVVDLAGRRIAVPAKIERIVLGEGRYLTALAILEREAPLARVAGMMGEFPLLDPASFAQWRKHLPAIADIPVLGRTAGDSFSVEKAVSLRPDLAIFGLAGHGPTPNDAEKIAVLEAAGVTVAFVDFFFDPIANTPRSVTLMGELLGRQAQAAEFVEAYEAARRLVVDRVAGAKTRPLVFVENRVGLQEECCPSIGAGVLGKLVESAGARNLGSQIISGLAGMVGLEYLLTHEPDIYLGTAIGNRETDARLPQRIALGPGVDAEFARAGLMRTLRRPGIAGLAAVREGRAFALWHHFFHSPFNVVALQAMAKMFQPELFADLDPVATHRDFMSRFQPVPLEGVYWVGLKK